MKLFESQSSIQSLASVALIAAVCGFYSSGCTESSFSGGANKMIKKNPSRISAPDKGGTTDLPAGSLVSDKRAIATSKKGYIWVADIGGTVTRFVVDENDKLIEAETKRWTGIAAGGGGGARTYVLEGGAFVAARFPSIYFIDPETTPQGPITPSHSILETLSLGERGRICLASYVKNNKRYLFAAYGAGLYQDIPMADEKPYRPNWAAAVPGRLATEPLWGYSCFIDQKKNIFYSQSIGVGGGAINLETLTAAPNPAGFPAPLGGLSYALAGDPDGKIYNKSLVYTSAYDSESDTIWMSYRDYSIKIYPRACIAANSNCAQSASYTPKITENGKQITQYIGPMSGFSNGGVVGVTRHGVGSVYLMRLVDKKDYSKGIKVTHLADSGDQGYMYTDFTGATLYVREAQQEFEISKIPGFKPGKPYVNTLFTWKSKQGASKPWTDIRLEARCYDNPDTKPGYEEVKIVGESEKYTIVTAGSCKGKSPKYVEIQVTQLNNGKSLADVEHIQVAVKQ